MFGRDQDSVGKGIKPRQVLFQRGFEKIQVKILKVFAVIRMVAHNQGQTPGTGVLHAPIPNSQFGDYVYQIGFKVVAASRYFSGQGKGQAAFRRKSRGNALKAVYPLVTGTFRPFRFARILRGKKDALDVLFIQIPQQSGKGIRYAVYFRHESIGKVGDFHLQLLD
jgi:hypothetical protein